MKKVLNDILSLAGANLINFATAGITIFFLPKVMTTNSFGYFQFIQLISAYANILQLGWTDGIYLRFGGKYYKDLDLNKLSAQFWMLLFWGGIISTLFLLFLSDNGTSETIFLSILGAVLIFTRPASIFLQVILQMTGRNKEYALVPLVSGLVFIIFQIVGLIMDISDVRFYSLGFVLSMVSALILAILKNWKLVFSDPNFHNFFGEVKENISVGVKLTIGSYSALGIIGVVQWLVKLNFSISTFARLSIALSLTNVLLPFINSISLALFPSLKRDMINQSKMYVAINTLINYFLPILLLTYFLIAEILKIWLPAYQTSITYLSILFPLVAMQAKYEIVNNTFLKSLREEKFILVLNVICVALSFSFVIILICFYPNITLILVGVDLVLLIRLYIATKKVQKVIITKSSNTKFYSILIVFMIFGVITNGSLGLHFILYLVTVVLYMITDVNKVYAIIKNK